MAQETRITRQRYRFLAPAQDQASTITSNRKRAMEVIAVMNANLQLQIPNQVGVYDDSFNINCVGDTFQAQNIPTILFEAGHYKDDYEREEVRAYIFQSLLVSLDYIAKKHRFRRCLSSLFRYSYEPEVFFTTLLLETLE